MRTKRALTATLLTSALSTAATAQSSVTLYGTLDAGIGYTSNAAASLGTKGASKVQALSGIGIPARWGLRGVEDLGAGYSTVFVLENGYSIQNGTMLQGGREFGRQAYVALSKSGVGMFSLGRQYDPYFDLLGPFTSARQWGGQFAAHIGDVDNMFASFRLNNSVKFTTANLSGFVVSGLYAFSNQASGGNGTGFSNNSAWSAAGSYTRGPINAAIGYLHLSRPSTGATGGSNTGGAVVGDYGSPTDIFFTNPLNTQDIASAGASYQFSSATLSAYYSHSRLRYVDGSSLSLSNYELNARYSFTPALQGGLAAIYTAGDMDGANLKNVVSGPHPKWIQFNAGLTYLLSVRTSLYAIVVYQRAMSDAQVAAIDAAGGPTSVGVHHQVGAAIGVSHRF